jgi:hypothetical protein
MWKMLMSNDDIHTCSNECQRPVCVAVREAVAAEREECATLCDGVAGAAKINTAVLPESHHRMVAADDCADLIRARGQQ